MRFQSVLDCLLVLFTLFMICLSQRDDADRIVRSFRERYKGNAIPHHPNCNPSLLAIFLARIGTNKKSATEHLFRLGEVESMLSDVGPILDLVPLKLHCNSKWSYISSVSDDCGSSQRISRVGRLLIGDGRHKLGAFLTDRPV